MNASHPTFSHPVPQELWFSVTVTQGGQGISGFVNKPNYDKLVELVRSGRPMQLTVNTQGGFSSLFCNPVLGSCVVKLSSAQEGNKVYAGIPVDANGNVAADPSLATSQIAPAQADLFHVTVQDMSAAWGAPPAATPPGPVPPPEPAEEVPRPPPI